MANKARLPIKIVESVKDDFYKPKHKGGGNKIFREVSTSFRRKIHEELNNVGEYFKKTLNELPNVPVVARVTLRKDALAKSHRPDILFNPQSCPIIGGRNFCELFISVTKQNLERLDEKIFYNKSKTIEANISTIERIEPYTAEDATYPVKLSELSKKLGSKENELRIRLFNHNRKNADNKLVDYFYQQMEAIGLNEPEELKYSKKIRIFKVKGVSAQHIKPLSHFVGTQNLATFAEFGFAEPSYIHKTKINLNDFAKPDKKINYPLIGLIDTGTNPSDNIISPWISQRYNYVPHNNIDYKHASFISGLAIYGQRLNDDKRFPDTPVKIIDVAAIPKNSRIREDELLDILHDVIPKHPEVKYWNLSLNTINKQVDDDTFSEFAIALDEIQDKYKTTFVISAGNYINSPMRSWPPNSEKINDRIFPPAESVRGITIGSLAHLDKPNSLVKREEPSPFSRRGPGAAFLPKPEMTHYGGNCNSDGNYSQLGLISLNGNDQSVESVGTSFSTPLVTTILAHIKNSIKTQTTPCLIRALAIHSAVLYDTNLTQFELKYKGFGIPGDITSILTCSPWEATMIFEPVLREGFDFNKFPFPFPQCMYKDGKITGEVIITLCYDPPLDATAGAEYCQINVDASLGTCTIGEDLRPEDHLKQIFPSPKSKELKYLYEDYQIKCGFKWSPVKVYRRYMPNGVKGDHWNLKVRMLKRASYNILGSQKVAVIVTIRSKDKKLPVYDETIQLMRKIGWSTQDLQVTEQIKLQV